MIGSTIDRAMDRSIAVYESMTLSGFGTNMVVKGSQFKRGDSILFLLIILTILGVFSIIPTFLEVVLA